MAISSSTPAPADTLTAIVPQLSTLERIPNEILSKIFLMSRNLSLLETNYNIKDRLSADTIFNEFALLAFGRTTSCEDHDYHIIAPKVCTFCVLANKGQNTPQMVTNPELLEFKRDRAYGDSDFCRPPRGQLSGPHDCKIEKGCVISISEKRTLQTKILQSSWFSLRHVLRVDDSCELCSIQAAEGWKMAKEKQSNWTGLCPSSNCKAPVAPFASSAP